MMSTSRCWFDDGVDEMWLDAVLVRVSSLAGRGCDDVVDSVDMSVECE